MLEIAIDELGIGNDKVAYVKLPANKNDVIDALDRAKIYGKTFLRIEECDEVPELAGYEFSEEPTLDELNFLAKRLEEIANDVDNPTQIIAYRALLQRGFGRINEAINCTYNLETIPVYPCRNVREYGEIVLDNDMLEELEDVSDEVYDLLDPDKVGRTMMEREGGVFIDGYYAVPSSYEPALVYDEELSECMENWIFRLEITGNSSENENVSEKNIEVLILPADEEYMRQLVENLGEKSIDECVCVGFESAIPQISEVCFESMEDVNAMNDIARRYSELSRKDSAKFKAVLEHELWRGWDKVNAILNDLDCYEFDKTINHVSEFGEKYLSKMLPPDFDRSLLDGALNDNFGSKILRENKCVITGYGAVSHCGGHLYEMIEAPEQEQETVLEMGENFMKYQIKCADPEQHSMFFSDCDPALRNACIGHLRIDFGSDNEFWNTWWENRGDLNDSAFKAELGDVVNELRKDGLLKNRSEMQRYCATHQNLNLNESYGFSVETADRLFLLRCRPERGNYDCYCYCYDKRELQLAQSQEQTESQSPELSL